MLCVKCGLGEMDRQEYLHIERDTQKEQSKVSSLLKIQPQEKIKN